MLLSLLLVVVPLSAAVPVRDMATQPPVPLLWEVSQGQARLYLLGSFHLLKPEDYPVSSDVDQAFADARRLVFELAPEEMDSPELSRQMMRAAQRQDGQTLQQELDTRTWRKLQAYAEKRQLPLEAWQHYRPWFVGLTISLTSMAQQGMQPVLGLDRYFMRRARASGKSATGLERADDQIALLAGMTTQEQRQMLAEALEDAGEGGDRQIERLHAAWRHGDAALLWHEMAQDLWRQYPALYRRIDVERNDRWVPQLKEMLQDAPTKGNVLVVVGALHLLGEEGLVEKLRACGYRVKRICSACASRH